MVASSMANASSGANSNFLGGLATLCPGSMGFVAFATLPTILNSAPQTTLFALAAIGGRACGRRSA